jgi:type III restriction enzyme
MKLKFDSQQPYQLEAIQSVVSLFKGQPMSSHQFEFKTSIGPIGLDHSELGFSNRLLLSDHELLANIQSIQEQNGLEIVQGDDLTPLRFGNHFSIEMETGTGKTYVYLRTIFELYQQYGFTKFIIVVPSIAIREGVKTALDLTAEHFRELYNNIPMTPWVYDSRYVSRLREFASSNHIQILIMNIDAFNKKDIAVIHSERDQVSGRRPIEFIQACNPIVILDEPQNMETETAKAAIQSLNPLCTLRYSATHRNHYNLLYRLGPVKAYDLGLVKRIEVDSVLEDPNYNTPYIAVKKIENTSKSKIVATLEIDVETKNGPQRKTIKVSNRGEDLQSYSKRENYNGYIVEEINSGYKYISFTNGITLNEGVAHGAQTDERLKIQIKETIKEHLEKELRISTLPKGHRIKVLSLFFIDRVSNYRSEEGDFGKLALWFNELYEDYRKHDRYKQLNLPASEQVHDGYFAQDKKGQYKDSKESSENQYDRDAYTLIMKDKVRLLSFDEPLRFIFSHSALREGWDNPNVFQICTLNESRSDIRKRQEIGRGLRLPVREDGSRCFDKQVNRLTVIANESYDDFAKRLQFETEEETGETFEGRIQNKRDRRTVTLKKGWRHNEDFKELWNRIKHKTSYAVCYSTEELIQDSARTLSKMNPIVSPKFNILKSEVVTKVTGLETKLQSVRGEHIHLQEEDLPDLVGYLQSKTELTRGTLAQILIKSGRLKEVYTNPQAFLEQSHEAIQQTMKHLMVQGIKYEKIEDDYYEMMLFKDKEIESYMDHMLAVNHSIVDAIEFDSETERKFAENLDARSDIKLFLKLPKWFIVKTPLGSYNPDWAIVKEDANQFTKLYLVRETKGSILFSNLRDTESLKITCGRSHFKAIEVDFDVAVTAESI